MGVYYTAYAAVGCRVPEERLLQRKRGRSCTHTLPEGAAKFCPQCGKPTWRDYREEIAGFDRGNGKLHGFPVVFYGEGQDAIVCVKGGLVEADKGEAKSVPLEAWSLDDGRHDLYDMMRENGMGSYIDTFGLWAVMYGG